MNALIKYISLLLFSGLIIPFYYYHTPGKNAPVSKKIKAAVQRTKNTEITPEKSFSIIELAAATLIPSLKISK
ncbi:hypothetical protein GCM10023149_25750 [Mucilaginibacter gynuensis]|uniref:Uncharacterized protein n=1 Tax=Mucilaginibacter gynuensis TaxID=1302236 RepID=A0ABP8GH35_9SPHI